MRYRRALPFAVVVVFLASYANWIRADEATVPATRPTQFMRYVEPSADGACCLQAADVAYQNKDGVRVHLVSAVHIGERSYFEGLNDSFKGYDAVLYELVKPKDAAAPQPGVVSDNPISQFQHFLKDSLNLEFQLDVVDYTAKNFVHADLDKDTFEKMQDERGESMMTLMLKQMMAAFNKKAPEVAGAAAADDPNQDLKDMVKVIVRPDGERQLKRMLAKQLGDMEDGMGLDGDTVIVTERNKAAMKVLSDQMTAGKKNLAIFYGAAHMKDMSQRLEAMGFSPVSTQWRTAWDLTIRPEAPSMAEKVLDTLIDALGND